MTKEMTIIKYYREQIREQKLQKGDMLPTENEMCELFDASRMTVRKALNEMVSQGWIYRVSGVGTFIAPAAFHRVFTVQGFSHYMSEKGYLVKSVVLKFEKVHPEARIASLLGIEEKGEAWHLIRSRAVDGTVLAIESVMLNVDRFPDLDKHDFQRGSLYQVMKKEYHCEVVSSSQKINTARIEGEYARLFWGEDEGVALKATNLAYTKDGVLVEYEEALYNGYEFSIDIFIRKEWGE